MNNYNCVTGDFTFGIFLVTLAKALIRDNSPRINSLHLTCSKSLNKKITKQTLKSVQVNKDTKRTSFDIVLMSLLSTFNAFLTLAWSSYC